MITEDVMITDIVQAVRGAPSHEAESFLPHARSWDDLSQNAGRHVLAEVNIAARSSDIYRMTIIHVKCSKCNWEGYIYSTSKLTCRFCRAPLSVQDQFSVEYREARVLLPDGNTVRALLLAEARDLKSGYRRVIAYLTWKAESKKKREVPVLLILREVGRDDKPRVNIKSMILSVPDPITRLNVLVNVVARTYNIVGLRSHILLILAVLTGAHGVWPFVDDDPAGRRWWIHGALIGEPGTGKSMLTRIIESCTPHGRAMIISAGGVSTLPGLTVGTYEGKHYEGPLVLLSGGPRDFGVLVLEEAHTERLEVLHQIKDALERGRFMRATAAAPPPGQTKTSILLVANFVGDGLYRGIKSLPPWLRDTAFSDRLDFVAFTFEPVGDMAREIARAQFSPYFSTVRPVDIAAYIEEARIFTPNVEDYYTIRDKIYEYAEKLRAALQDVGIYRSSARLRESIARLTVALAKLALSNVTPALVDYVYEILQSQIDALNEATLRYVQSHAIPASEYTIRKTILDILNVKRTITRDSLIAEVCEKLEKQFYRCTEDKVDRVIEKLKQEGMIYEPELGKISLVTYQQTTQ